MIAQAHIFGCWGAMAWMSHWNGIMVAGMFLTGLLLIGAILEHVLDD